MTIKILPARLANQIAAGEVVERPASVVKELVENSLDAGATRIDIDIEKGGAKMIRIRDNGKGIAKDELGLALSRHATSKIHTLDDLEAIVSLGFRGEALASISSVARLTLTSRTATQDQAWSAFTEGRDMAVKLSPAAHPIGSTVEVLDLFFNTPARRKFLRTEKTEFGHIDELLKRIALSRFDVTINLRHNGKMIRQYRAAKNQAQTEKRIAAVCGAQFVRHMLRIELEHQGLKLHGWITTPEGARQQSDLQYCYVNSRMMRDKLINHAIRQSYETSLKPDQYAAYVLFIEIDPHQVDVNVHPAKHEVRFHQARLVHDFIYQALASGLAQSDAVDQASPQVNEAAFHRETESHPSASRSELDNEYLASSTGSREASQDSVAEQTYQAVDNVPAYPGRSDYVREPKPTRLDSSHTYQSSNSPNEWQESRPEPASRKKQEERFGEKPPSKAEVKAYKALMTTVAPTEQSEQAREKPAQARDKSSVTPSELQSETLVEINDNLGIEQVGKAVTIVDRQYVMTATKSQALLVSLVKAEYYRTLGQLSSPESLKSQPLLVPLSCKLESELIEMATEHQEALAHLGIQLQVRNKQSVMVMGVPSPLRQQNLQQLLPDLLSYALSCSGSDSQTPAWRIWLATQVTQVKSDYTLSEAIQIISEVEQLWHGTLPFEDGQFIRPIDFSATIAKLQL